MIHLYPCKLAPCFSFCLDLGSLVASQFCVCDCHLFAPGIICWSCWTLLFRGSGFTLAFLMWSDLPRQQQQLQQQMQQQQQQQQQLQQQMQQQQMQQQQLLQMQQLSPQQLQQLQMQLQQQITLQWGSSVFRGSRFTWKGTRTLKLSGWTENMPRKVIVGKVGIWNSMANSELLKVSGTKLPTTRWTISLCSECS